MATTTAPNPENPMKKTLDQPSDPNPTAEIVSPNDSAPDPSKSPPSAGEKEEDKAASAVAGGDDSSQADDNIQKKMKRAERFGMPVQLSEEEKRNSRAERFGLVKSDTTDEEAKKKARLTRFAPPVKTDPVEEDKRKARAIRFSQPQPGSQANGKGNVEQEAVAVDKAGGET